MLKILKFTVVFSISIALLAGLLYIGSFVIVGLLMAGAAFTVIGLALLLASFIGKAITATPPRE